MPAGAGTDGGGGPGPRAREILTPSIVYALRRRKPVPIVPPHEPLRVGKVLRSLQEIPSDGGMGPGFRRESEGIFAEWMFKPISSRALSPGQELARGRCRLSRSLAGDQDRVLEIFARR